eukprot:Hpha_TRINITY_DN22206_c0_g1::TRINITY_DN22206_c0_g1_i1::g.167209::m.167209
MHALLVLPMLAEGYAYRRSDASFCDKPSVQPVDFPCSSSASMLKPECWTTWRKCPQPDQFSFPQRAEQIFREHLVSHHYSREILIRDITGQMYQSNTFSEREFAMQIFHFHGANGVGKTEASKLLGQAMSLSPGPSGLGQATLYLTSGMVGQPGPSVTEQIKEKILECRVPLIILDDLPSWTTAENNDVSLEVLNIMKNGIAGVPMNRFRSTIFVITSDYGMPFLGTLADELDQQRINAYITRDGFKELYRFFSRFSQLGSLQYTSEVLFKFLEPAAIQDVFEIAIEKALCKDKRKLLDMLTSVEIQSEVVEQIIRSPFGSRENGRLVERLIKQIEAILDAQFATLGVRPQVYFSNGKWEGEIDWRVLNSVSPFEVLNSGTFQMKRARIARDEVEDEDLARLT